MGDPYEINAVDTHIHLWDLGKWKYAWPGPITEKEIFRNFSMEDYNSERKQTPIKNSVFVEAHNSLEETRWILETTESEDCFVKGVVGYAHTSRPEILDKELEEFTKFPKFTGVRNVLQAEASGWLGSVGVNEGMKVIKKYGLTYDLLLKKENFTDAIKVVRNNPGMKFVIDHLAKPNAKTGETRDWFEGMEALAGFCNVHCKLSGMVTEADLDSWKPDDFTQYVHHVTHIFGTDRVMFGSDWPVCKMAHANLDTVHDLLHGILENLDFSEKKKVFETNAIQFYGLQC